MKKIIIMLLLLVAFASCNNSTKDKLKKAVKSSVEQMIKDRGEKVESIKIDSLAYGTVSMKDFYKFSEKRYYDLLAWTNKTLMEELNEGSENNKFLDTLKRDIFKYRLYINALDSLSKSSDSTQNIWDISYHFKAASNKNTWDNHADSYFDKNFKLLEAHPEKYVSDADIESSLNEFQ